MNAALRPENERDRKKAMHEAKFREMLVGIVNVAERMLTIGEAELVANWFGVHHAAPRPKVGTIDDVSVLPWRPGGLYSPHALQRTLDLGRQLTQRATDPTLAAMVDGFSVYTLAILAVKHVKAPRRMR